MDDQLKTIAVCCVCKDWLDLREPHAIVKSDYAHLKCADDFDSCEWGREFKQGDVR